LATHRHKLTGGQH